MYLSGDPQQDTPAPQGAGRVSGTTLPAGDRGTAKTLALMADLAGASSGDYWLLLTARRIVSACAERDTLCQARAIRRWLADHWRFVPDPLRKEALRSPADMIDEFERLGFVQGDCDEAATLGWALGEAVGLVPRFKVVALGDDPGFRHVFAELATAGGWIDLDVTARNLRGPLPPVTREWIFSL